MYHKIAVPPRNSTRRGLHVSPSSLDKQLNLLAEEGYQFCDFQDLIQAIEGGVALPPRAVILTFDDGHLDNYTAALPILKRYGAKASVFIIAGDMGKTGLVWEEGGERAPASLLSWDHAREMHRAGFSIQAHGLTHRHHTRIAQHGLMYELQETRRLITAQVGVAPVALAYPYGDYNDACKTSVQEAGYRFACTTKEGVNRLSDLDLFALNRVTVKGYRWHHFWKFKRQVSSGFE
jgi:peptidoglycan/xylan/chitin deacetylase (PgdA/CDA1 family)